MSRRTTPTPTQQKALALATRGGLVRSRGGFWSYPGCPTRETRYMETIDLVPEVCVTIQTIAACIDRGWMIRQGVNFDDPVHLTERGKVLVKPSDQPTPPV